MAVTDDYYEILKLSREATAEEIKRAYRAESLKSHPDRFPGDAQKEARFKEVTEAYETLSDADRRARYDLLHKSHAVARTKGELMNDRAAAQAAISRLFDSGHVEYARASVGAQRTPGEPLRPRQGVSVEVELYCPRGTQIAQWEWDEFRNALEAFNASDPHREDVGTRQKRHIEEDEKSNPHARMSDERREEILGKVAELLEGLRENRADDPKANRDRQGPRRSEEDIITFKINEGTSNWLIDQIDRYHNDVFFRGSSRGLAQEGGAKIPETPPASFYLSKCCIIAGKRDVFGGLLSSRNTLEIAVSKDLREGLRWSLVTDPASGNRYAAFTLNGAAVPPGLEARKPADHLRYYKNALSMLGMSSSLDKDNYPRYSAETGRPDSAGGLVAIANPTYSSRIAAKGVIPPEIAAQVSIQRTFRGRE